MSSNPLYIDRYSQIRGRSELLAQGISLLGHHQGLEVSVKKEIFSKKVGTNKKNA